MSIVDGKGLIEWEGMLFEPGSDLLARTHYVFALIRGEGGSIEGNEAGRPYGVPGDQYARHSNETASGLSTVWFQWGRMLRGETPAAADPRGGVLASDHTKGIATDTNASNIEQRRRAMRLVGMIQTIDSESWHFAIRYPSQVDLTGWADIGSQPFDNGEDDMFDAAAEQRMKDFISASVTARVEQILQGADLFKVFYNTTYGVFALAAPGTWAVLDFGTGEQNWNYYLLLIARGIITERRTEVPDNEWTFYRDRIYLTSEANDNATLAAVKALPADVAKALAVEADSGLEKFVHPDDVAKHAV